MSIQSHRFFRVALLAFLAGIDLSCQAFDEDEANPPPDNYSGVWIVKRGDGKVMSEVSYKEGKRQGLAQYRLTNYNYSWGGENPGKTGLVWIGDICSIGDRIFAAA
ncbi:MAG: hypothetical protein ACYC3X_30135 [Pirellulaceae bacterium]